MPFPQEYQRATDHFYAFLEEVRDLCGYGSCHQAYTTSQAVLQAFRRRLTLSEGIRFATGLPVGLRALFVADWDPEESTLAFCDRGDLVDEVRQLRKDHNFSDEDAVANVAVALWRHVDPRKLTAVLSALPPGAAEFWRSDERPAT